MKVEEAPLTTLLDYPLGEFVFFIPTTPHRLCGVEVYISVVV